MTSETMTAAYIEAVYFTDTGDSDQPPGTAALTALFKAQAYFACNNFLRAASGKLDNCDPTQLGHDLWLTRNGHGTGFWDRPELYGRARADLFTRLATAQGEHDSEWEEMQPEGETK